MLPEGAENPEGRICDKGNVESAKDNR